MESPKYDFIAQNLSSTRVLLHKMEENMRSQLSKPHKSSKPYNFSDNITTKRCKNASEINKNMYKNEKELDFELELLRKRLNSEDFIEKSSLLDKENVGFSNENVEFFPTKQEKLNDFNEKFKEINEKFNEINENSPKKTFNEMKYEVEIKLLRNELEKVKKTKETLENELKSLKKLSKAKHFRSKTRTKH